MAQWNQAERTIQAKIVYYGPAFGGKTTNLVALHRRTDPAGSRELLSIQTGDDRTLFFDLLPLDLGEILGHRVALKLFTVPGQVRYEATRKVVLAGADAVIFVADSSPGRTDQNRWSLQNLRLNMRANRLDPALVPLVFQANKQDLPEAATAQEVVSALGLRDAPAIAAVACDGRGVVETLLAATQALLDGLVRRADDGIRRGIDPAALADQVARAFAPFLAEPSSAAGRQLPEPTRVVPSSDDLLQKSIQTSVKLGEKLAVQTARAGRLEHEAEAFRRLSEALCRVGTSFDHDAIVDSALGFAAEVLGATVVSIIVDDPELGLRLERSWSGLEDPLLAFAEGRPLLRRMISAGQPCLIEDLAAECGTADASLHLYGLRCAMAVPVDTEPRRCLVAYGEPQGGSFARNDVRFMATLAGHLGVGLQKARAIAELRLNGERLAHEVARRTAQLRRACADLREAERIKDRFLSGLSHELKTPLTAILSGAVYLRDYEGDAEPRREMARTIVAAAETSQRLLDGLFRAVELRDLASSDPPSETTARALARRALELCGHRDVRCRIRGGAAPIRVEPEGLARAVANLVDNAVKFSSRGRGTELRIDRLEPEGSRADARLEVAVLDRGPGVPAELRSRIFEPFEQGGDALTTKPSGIGLGLYEAALIVRRHGGTIECRGRAGGGSEFRFTIPLVEVARERADEVAHA